MKHPEVKKEQVLEKLSGRKILVVGDVMLDKYLSGVVQRISPEAPVPVLHYENTRSHLGGAANVALNIREMGNEAFIASILGRDEEGDTMSSLFDENAIDTSCLLHQNNRITTTKIRVMASNQHLLRVDKEEIKPLEAHERSALLEGIEQTLKNKEIEAVIFQDYNKGLLDQHTIADCLALCRTYGIPTTVDPKFENFYAFKGVDIFKPNLLELQRSLPFAITPTRDDLQKAAAHLRSKLACRIVLITLSDKGIFADNGDESILIPVTKRSITDVCGAGDTVISMATLAMVAGFSLYDLAFWSSYAGTLVCQFPGVVPVTHAMFAQSGTLP